jgi:hypothetical protein
MATGYILIAAQGPERLILMVSILQELRLLYCRCMTDFKLKQKIQISEVYAKKWQYICTKSVHWLDGTRFHISYQVMIIITNISSKFYLQEAFSNTSTAEEF